VVDPSRLHVPTKAIEIVPYVPHAAILPWASAVVTHAGHGTLTAALAHGLPIVAIPNEAADQPALAAQAARLGAGIHLHDEGATATAIASAIRTVLDDSTYAANARALGDRIHTYSNQPRAVVERILGHASSGQLTATGESSSSQSIGLQIDWSQ
jgi:UDP:flavonoid glycosyltransferase YjiC (YdhE family)